MERARGLPVVMLAWVMPAAVSCTSSVTTGEVTPPACTTHVHRVERHAFAGARLTVAVDITCPAGHVRSSIPVTLRVDEATAWESVEDVTGEVVRRVRTGVDIPASAARVEVHVQGVAAATWDVEAPPMLEDVQMAPAADGSNCVLVSGTVQAPPGERVDFLVEPAAGGVQPRAGHGERVALRVAPSTVGRVVRNVDVRVTPRVMGVGVTATGRVELNVDSMLESWSMPSARMAGAGPSGVAVADFDADGLMDTLVASHGTDQVVLLAGEESGAPITYVTGRGPEMVVVHDVNGDGWPDAVLCNHDSNTVTVLRNVVGKLVLEEPVEVGINPYALAVTDLDMDGRTEIVTVLETTGELVVVTTRADGRRELRGAPMPVGYLPHDVKAADVNADGWPDVVVANSGDGTVMVLLNDGAGGLVPHATLDRPVTPEAVELADVDGDGVLDLLVATFGGLSVSIGTGTGLFAAEQIQVTGGRPIDARAVDLDLDGDVDVAVANYGGGTITVLRNDGVDGLVKAVELPVGRLPRRVVVADMDADGLPDLVSALSGEDAAVAHRNQGTRPCLTAAPGITRVPLVTKGDALVMTDVDGDGRLDALVQERADAGRWSVVRGGEGGTWKSGEVLVLTDSPAHVRMLERRDGTRVPLVTGEQGALAVTSWSPISGVQLSGRMDASMLGDADGDGEDELWTLTPSGDLRVVRPVEQGGVFGSETMDVDAPWPMPCARAHGVPGTGVFRVEADWSVVRQRWTEGGDVHERTVHPDCSVTDHVILRTGARAPHHAVDAFVRGRELHGFMDTPVLLPEEGVDVDVVDVTGDGTPDAVVLGTRSLLVVNGRMPR